MCLAYVKTIYTAQLKKGYNYSKFCYLLFNKNNQLTSSFFKIYCYNPIDCAMNRNNLIPECI